MKSKPKRQLATILILFCLTLTSAAHYITGIVNDAEDLESADNKIITLWNPANGQSDNQTDIIGPSGNSGTTATYSIDCESLQTPCQEDDILYLKVFNQNNYGTTIIQFNVTSSNPDYVDDMQLNSPPQVSIASPANNTFTNQATTSFICNLQDADSESSTLSLWANFSGSMQKEYETTAAPGNTTFQETLSQGTYAYYCQANDSLVTTTSQTNIITLDTTSPTISSLTLNTSTFCGETTLTITCETTDNTELDEVLIQAKSPTTSTNYTTTQTANNFSKSLTISETGIWNFTCFSTDLAGNTGSQTTSSINLQSSTPNLKITSNQITFNNTSPKEGETIEITAMLNNTGCVQANNFLAKIYEGNPTSGGTEIDSQLLSISQFSSETISTSYLAKVGGKQIYVSLDTSEIISESNESDNIAYKTLSTPSWQVLYGAIESVKVLGTSEFNIDSWVNATSFSGNVFISDTESSIDWLSLLAIGRKTNNDPSSDLTKIDSFLQTSTFEDSLSQKFSSAQEETFTVSNQEITNVKTIQSTSNNNFKTGILWDSSDDTDGEYGGADKEDLVFVSKINPESAGEYGTYDYEISFPVKLREYETSDTQYVYFYYDLV